MARKEVLDYIQEELNSIDNRIRKFTDYGYSGELSPLVNAMCDYEKRLKELEIEEMECELKKKRKSLNL